jgi:hypothetical protein
MAVVMRLSLRKKTFRTGAVVKFGSSQHPRYSLLELSG